MICDLTASLAGAAWSADGQIFLGSDSGLFRVPASGGTPAPLTAPDRARGERSHQWPQILSGGRVIFFISSDRAENTGVYAVSLARPANACIC